MALLTKADLDTHLYAEIVNEITRNNDTLVTKAIANGEGEVRAYLNRFNCAVIFGGSYNDQFLKSITLDIVCWHLIKLANPNIKLELFKTCYDDAIKTLDKVQSGKISPAWPLVPNDPATSIDEAGNIEWSSNTKRNNHY